MFAYSVIGRFAHGFVNKFNFLNILKFTTPTKFQLTVGGGNFLFNDFGAYYRRQWWRGLKSSGVIGSYSEVTIQIKKAKGLPYDRVTLFDTGANYLTFRVITTSRELLAKPGVAYFDKLVRQYGSEILFLHPSELQILRGDIKKAVFKVIDEIKKIR